MNNINLEKLIKLACVSASLENNLNKRLFGEVFTVLDASALDSNSKKAVKSLISQAFTRTRNRIEFELNNLSDEIVKVESSLK